MGVEHGQQALEVALAFAAACGGDMRGDHRDPQRQRQFEPPRVAELVPGAGEGTFLASVRKQRQAERLQLFVERRDGFVCGIDVHDVRQPLHEQGALGGNLLQALEGVVAVRIHAGAEAQVVVAGNFAGDEGVGHVELGGLPIQLACGVHHAVERQHHGAADLG